MVTSTIYGDSKLVLEMVKSDGPFGLRTRHLILNSFLLNNSLTVMILSLGFADRRYDCIFANTEATKLSHV